MIKSISILGTSQLRKNHLYYNQLKHEVTTVWIKRKSAKALFSTFKNNKPKLDQFYIHERDNHQNFEEIEGEVIEKLFYEGSFSNQNLEFTKVVDNFKEKNGIDTRYTTRRVSVLFGSYGGRSMPFYMKLSYYKDMGSVNDAGWLRLYFTYMTFDRGMSNHLLPWEKRIERLEKKGIATKKRKKSVVFVDSDNLNYKEKEEVEEEEVEPDLDIYEYERKLNEKYGIQLN